MTKRFNLPKIISDTMDLYISIVFLICAVALLITLSALIMAVILIRELHDQLATLRKGPVIREHHGHPWRERI
jgi:hypothetical protein